MGQSEVSWEHLTTVRGWTERQQTKRLALLHVGGRWTDSPAFYSSPFC